MMRIKKWIALLLSITIFSSFTNALAVEIDRAGDIASVPVEIMTEDLTFSVTVPTSLPVNVDSNGVITVAMNAKIVNNSGGSVKVTSVKVEGQNEWVLVNYADLSAEKVNAKKFGFAINDVGVNPSTGLCESIFESIPANDELPFTYNAYVTPQSSIIPNVTMASVIFTLDWDTVLVTPTKYLLIIHYFSGDEDIKSPYTEYLLEGDKSYIDVLNIGGYSFQSIAVLTEGVELMSEGMKKFIVMPNKDVTILISYE